MYTLLLAVIYLAFISLGLPDPLLGAAWPGMFTELNVPVSYAGIISLLITLGTVASSLFSNRLIRRFGTARITTVSVALTAVTIFLFGLCSRFWQLCIIAFPYGLGAGAIDTALNNYVALHYSSRHMSWLHCFWGVGTIIGPYILSTCLMHGIGWRGGYRAVSIIQAIITAVIFMSLPLWSEKSNSESSSGQVRSIGEVLRIDGVKYVLIAFFCYCALESTAGLWASSYLAIVCGVSEDTAAKLASLFYIGITIGRFISGLVADHLGDRRLIRIGSAIILIGISAILLPLGSTAAMAGLIIIGFGCAPIYPSIIHSTPTNFGAEDSQAIIGIQMASAYTGSALMPPVFGLIFQHISPRLYPAYMLIFAVLMLVMIELLNQRKKAQK